MNTDMAWELWGERDPYYGVLTDPKFRLAALTAESRDEFFASGRHHVTHVIDVCRRHIDPAFSPLRVLDFGCGVGRLVMPFAAAASEVVGMDISPSMLAEARRNCDALGLNGVSLVLSDDALSQAHGCFDLVHSCIVLQHIEVSRGRELFAKLVQKVRPGGCGAIHVTFGWGGHAESFGVPPTREKLPPPTAFSQAKASVKRFLEPLGVQQPEPASAAVDQAMPDPDMQMNCYNLSELMFILQGAGVDSQFSEFTNHGGALGAFLYFKRPQ